MALPSSQASSSIHIRALWHSRQLCACGMLTPPSSTGEMLMSAASFSLNLPPFRTLRVPWQPGKRWPCRANAHSFTSWPTAPPSRKLVVSRLPAPGPGPPALQQPHHGPLCPRGCFACCPQGYPTSALRRRASSSDVLLEVRQEWDFGQLATAWRTGLNQGSSRVGDGSANPQHLLLRAACPLLGGLGRL